MFYTKLGGGRDFILTVCTDHSKLRQPDLTGKPWHSTDHPNITGTSQLPTNNTGDLTADFDKQQAPFKRLQPMEMAYNLELGRPFSPSPQI